MADSLWGKRTNQLKPRERRLILIVGVLIGCWVVVSWIVQPLWDHVHDLRLEVESKMEKVEALGRLLAQAPALEREEVLLRDYLEGGEEAQAQGAFLNELETLSRSCGIQLNLKPRPPKQETHLVRFEVEMDLEGPQQSLLSFLDGLLRMRKLIEIERLRLSSVPTKESQLRASVVVERLSLRR